MYIAQRAEIFVRFTLRHTVTEIRPNFLFRETNFLFGIFGHTGRMYGVYIAHRAQIFVRFALRRTVSEIRPNFLFRETNFLFELMNFLFGIFSLSML